MKNPLAIMLVAICAVGYVAIALLAFPYMRELGDVSNAHAAYAIAAAIIFSAVYLAYSRVFLRWLRLRLELYFQYQDMKRRTRTLQSVLKSSGGR